MTNNFISSLCSAKLLYTCLLASLLNQVTAGGFAINSDIKKDFLTYAKKDEYVVNEEGKFNFAQGTWYLVESEDLIEFHPKFSGFLNFSMGMNKFFYKALYLEAPYRVLVFPFNGSHFTYESERPFVDRSLVEFEDEEDEPSNALQIYPHYDEESQTDLSLNQAFQHERFTEKMEDQDLADLAKKWNFLPYLNPDLDSYKMSKAFNNNWGAFKEFGDRLLELFKTPLDSSQHSQLIADTKNKAGKVLLTGVLSRLVRFLYYDDVSQITLGKSDHLKSLKAIRTMPFYENIVDNLKKMSSTFNDKYDQYVERITSIILPVTEELSHLYLPGNMDEYLDFFLPFQNFKSLNLLLAEHDVNRSRLDFYDVDYSWNVKVVNGWKELIKEAYAQDINDPENLAFKTANANMHKASKNLIELIRELLEEEFDTIGNIIQQLSAEQGKYTQNNKIDYDTSQKMDDYIEDDNERQEQKKNSVHERAISARAYACKFSKNKKDAYFGKLVDKELDNLFISLILYEGTGQVMKIFENRSWVTRLDSLEAIKLSNLDLNKNCDDPIGRVLWLREILVMMGEMDYKIPLDNQLFSVEANQIFSAVGRRLII